MKKRLDLLLVERGVAATREKARAMIMAGLVLVNETSATKAGMAVPNDCEIRVRGGGSKYVSRGGDKLAGALDAFNIDTAGLDTIDIGASTGGFTDCLLQRGARSVCSVDVGYGQLDFRLRNDARVTVMEKTNARNLKPEDFDRRFDLAVVDVSFISLLKVLPTIPGLLKTGGRITALVKPQFEAGRGRAAKGVVRDPETHIEVLNSLIEGASTLGLRAAALCHSALKGPKGNIEFFILLDPAPAPTAVIDVSSIVALAHKSFLYIK